MQRVSSLISYPFLWDQQFRVQECGGKVKQSTQFLTTWHGIVGSGQNTDLLDFLIELSRTQVREDVCSDIVVESGNCSQAASTRVVSVRRSHVQVRGDMTWLGLRMPRMRGARLELILSTVCGLACTCGLVCN